MHAARASAVLTSPAPTSSQFWPHASAIWARQRRGGSHRQWGWTSRRCLINWFSTIDARVPRRQAHLGARASIVTKFCTRQDVAHSKAPHTKKTQPFGPALLFIKLHYLSPCAWSDKAALGKNSARHLTYISSTNRQYRTAQHTLPCPCPISFFLCLEFSIKLLFLSH